MRIFHLTPLILLALAGRCLAADLEWVRVADDNRSFTFKQSAKRFVPWGFNYDHDEGGRLIEDYWDKQWATVAEDFLEMKQLGANVVRIHLQFGRFMEAADKPNWHSLDQLERLVKLAEQTGLYLDLTGLGCYHKKDVPQWYDKLDEPGFPQAPFLLRIRRRRPWFSRGFCKSAIGGCFTYRICSHSVTVNKGGIHKGGFDTKERRFS